MNDHARRGRNTIIAIIAVYFLLDLLLIFFEVAVTHHPPEISTFIRLGLSALLAWFLYRGMSWARWLWGILLLLGVLVILALGVSFLDAAGAHPVILLFSCAGLIYFLGSAVLLFLSPDVREYIGFRRSGSVMSGPLP
ncbi:MAG: hypothetical protein ACM3XO_13640 [Bacteroidota bacterium]